MHSLLLAVLARTRSDENTRRATDRLPIRGSRAAGTT